MNKIWKLNHIWNECLDTVESRPTAPRNRIWASELGKQDLDIYLKLMGEPVSNEFDARARRKFEAGNLFEWVVKLILMRCGIYKESQRWLGNSDFGIDVSGKLDHLAGGKVDYFGAKKAIDDLELPELFTKATDKILEHFAEKYPNGLPEQGIEVKSTSSFGIEKVYNTGRALAGHDLQAFHYAYITKLPFSLLYICRDDLRMAELEILPDDPSLLERYSNKIESVAGYYDRREEPAKEPEIVWDDKEQKFSKNFNVEYSSYLTRNYQYKNQEEFDSVFGPMVKSWNGVVGRIKAGKKSTDNNGSKIKDMEAFGFDIKTLVKVDNNDKK